LKSSTEEEMSQRAQQRILKEIKELSTSESSLFCAKPLEDNIFEWHFTIRGPRDTEFDGGVYHGRIVLPSEYPLKPPDFYFATPNGRFDLNKKVCLTISSHHAESWQPSWGIRTALLALIAFMPTRGDGAIASLDWSPDERKKLARESLKYSCAKCGTHNFTALPREDPEHIEVINQEEIKGICIKNKEEQLKDDGGEVKESKNDTSSKKFEPKFEEKERNAEVDEKAIVYCSQPKTKTFEEKERAEENVQPSLDGENRFTVAQRRTERVMNAVLQREHEQARESGVLEKQLLEQQQSKTTLNRFIGGLVLALAFLIIRKIFML
jgi:ubiquitin-conjugating enzyme E2 J1